MKCPLDLRPRGMCLLQVADKRLRYPDIEERFTEILTYSGGERVKSIYREMAMLSLLNACSKRSQVRRMAKGD